MFDHTDDDDSLPFNHLDDPRINDLDDSVMIDFDEVVF